MTAGAVARVPLTVENSGAVTWPHAGGGAVHLSYHVERVDADGKATIANFDGRRTPLPADVHPGGAMAVTGVVHVPAAPGRYRLRWDLVHEGVTWFSDRGNATGDQMVDVVAAGWPAAVPPPPPVPPLRPGAPVRLEDHFAAAWPSRLGLWRTAVSLWRRRPLLGIGPDNFRHVNAGEIAAGGSGRPHDDRIHANSLYLETLADLGLLGLAALGLVMAAFARVARARAAAGAGLLAAACGVAAGTFFVHGVLDWFFAFTPTSGLFWLLLALAGGAWAEPRAPSRAPEDSRRSAPPR
jgi:hypothetical protein